MGGGKGSRRGVRGERERWRMEGGRMEGGRRKEEDGRRERVKREGRLTPICACPHHTCKHTHACTTLTHTGEPSDGILW